MKKIPKRLIKIGLILLVIFTLFLLCSFINHRIKVKQDLSFLKDYDTGKIIGIDNKKVNYKIFNEENKENTIVLMGGSGVSDLSLSFEPLAKNLNAKIILINRPGYGFSDDTNEKATIEYIVNFYRDVLKELNIIDKIYLMPHSISGMYAMYWAEFYPNEINGIIGLDIGSPYLYVEEPNNKFTNYLSYLGSKFGIHRYIYKMGDSNTAIKNYDMYESDYFQAIWFMNSINPYSKFNLSEENLIKDNANKVIKSLNGNYYNINKLYIIADSINGEFYKKYEKANLMNYYKNEEKVKTYIETTKTSQEKKRNTLKTDEKTKFKFIEGPHLLYYYPTEELIQTINNFLKSI